MKRIEMFCTAVALLAAGVVLSSSAQVNPRGATAPVGYLPTDPQTIIAAADEDIATVMKLEIATLEWSRRHQVDEMVAQHAEDWIGIPNGPPMTREQMLEDVGTEVLRSYRISDVMARRIANDVVLVTYRMRQDGETGGGVKWVPLVQASSVWAKRQGKWLAVFYQETAL